MATTASVARRYYAYAATNSIGFYLPVGVLYLTQHHGFGLDVIGLTQGVFSLGILLAEIPTGYLGDRLGRRASLAIGHTLEPIAMAAFVVASTPGQYVAIYLLWALGYTFRSGTEDAWLYEALAAAGADGAFSRVKGRANTILFVTSAGTALAAGVLATRAWALPFLANATLSALGLPLVALLPAAAGAEAEPADGTEAVDDTGMAGDTEPADEAETAADTEPAADPEPASDAEPADDAVAAPDRPIDAPLAPREAAGTLATQLRRPSIRWFVLVAALTTALYSVTRAFEQPAASAVGVPLPAFGVMYAGFKLVSAGVSTRVGWVKDRLGAGGAFALFAPVMAVAYLGVAGWPALVLPVLFLNRSTSTLLRPLRNQYLNDRLGDRGRATVLSGVSMATSLVAAGAKFVAGWVAVGTGPVTLIAWAGVAIAATVGVVWVFADPARPASPAGSGIAGGEARTGAD